MSDTAVLDSKIDYSGNKIDVAKALKLRCVNKLTFNEIATHFNVTPQAIQQRLSKVLSLISDPQLTEAYSDSEIHLIRTAKIEFLSNMLDKKRLKDASVNNLAYAWKELNVAERLLTGQSTENISVMITESERAGLQKIAMEAGRRAIHEQISQYDVVTQDIVVGENEPVLDDVINESNNINEL